MINAEKVTMSIDIIIQMIYTEIGIDAQSIGQSAFDSAIGKRMEETKYKDINQYISLLKDSRKELTSLVEEIIVPETWFFRDNAAFDALVKYANKNKLNINQTPLRIMSIPSSSGEEAYSAAIALHEAGFTPEQVKIDAMDISQKNITHATNGIYRPNSFRNNMPEHLQNKYFNNVDNTYHINETIKQYTTFSKGNLFDINTLSIHEYYDVIFCKNLFIYFDSEKKKISFNKIKSALKTNGLLLIGHSECNIIPQGSFSPCDTIKSFGFIKTNIKKQKKPKKIHSQNPPRRLTSVKKKSWPPASNIKEPAPPVKKNTPEYNTNDAAEYANNGQLEHALNVCNKIAPDKQDANYFSLTATIYGALNNPQEAEKFYRKALFLDPYHVEALTHLSLLLDNNGERSKAKLLRQRLDKVASK